MNEQAEALKRRTKKFALDVLEFVRTLPATEEARVVGRQLIRSATGVGANYRATCRSRSQVEFIARIGVALEEADESAFWLEVLTEGVIAKSRLVFDLLDEADQISAILAVEHYGDRNTAAFKSEGKIRDESGAADSGICNLQC